MNLLNVQVHVDYITFGATGNSLYQEFGDMIHSEFEMSMMGKLNFFLRL